MYAFLLTALLGFGVYPNVAGDVHSYGNRFDVPGSGFPAVQLVHRELYRSTSPVPKNYTVVFSHISDKSEFEYAEIRVDNVSLPRGTKCALEIIKVDINLCTYNILKNPSFGELKMDQDGRTLNATITIPNAVNVVVTFTKRREGMKMFPDFESIFLEDQQRNRGPPRSFTIVNVQDVSSNSSKPSAALRHTAIGQRQPADGLLHFGSHNVTMQSRFASRLLEYVASDGQAITYVGLTFDVS